jgi:hypothetical protein
MSWLGAGGQVSTDVSPNVWCQKTGHSNRNVRYFENFKFNTCIKRVDGLQSLKYFVISVLKVKIKSPGSKIFILWDMGHVTYRLEAIGSKIIPHKEITYYTPYIFVWGNSQTYASVDAQLRSHIVSLP